MNKLKKAKQSFHQNKCQSKLIVNQKSGSKFLTPQEIISLLYRSQLSKQNLLKQIQQLNLDTQSLVDLPLNQLYLQCQSALKSTYSTKYLGLSNNQMGIISKRINQNQSIMETKQQPSQIIDQNATCLITKYFYPKPLKLGHKKRQNYDTINFKNLESNIKKAFVNKKAVNQQRAQMRKTRSKYELYTTFRGTNKRVVGSWISKQKSRIHEEKTQAVSNNIQNSVLSYLNKDRKRSPQNSRIQQNHYLGIVLPHLTYKNKVF